MKHSQVKGKTLQFTRSVKHEQTFFDNVITSHKKRFLRTYYDIENNFNITLEKIDSKKYIVKMDIETFHWFAMPKETVDFFIGHSKSHTFEYDEKINRNHHIFKDISMTFEYVLPDDEKRNVSIKFRSGGDYIVNENTYGEKLKQSNFFENGFSIFTYDGSEIVYEEVKA